MVAGVHRVFADNLRAACFNYGTIATVCDGAGVNRQQFNKYLSGHSIPNAITLRRICDFLGVAEQSLFAGKGIGTPLSDGAVWPVARNARKPARFWHNVAQSFDTIVDDISTGCYYCYFPMPNVPGMIVRTLMVVGMSSVGKEFVRLTRFQAVHSNSQKTVEGRHRGIIFANSSEIYFSAVNRHSPHQFSLITIERANTVKNKYFNGIALTRSGTGPISTKVCCQFLDSGKATKATIRSLGFLHASDKSIEPFVIYALAARR